MRLPTRMLMLTIRPRLGRRRRRRGPRPRTKARCAAAREIRGHVSVHFDVLLADAKRLASKPYTPRRNTLPAEPRQAEPGAIPQPSTSTAMPAIWRAEGLPFRIELLRAGFNQPVPPVTVSTVEAGRPQDLDRHARHVRHGAGRRARRRPGVPAAVRASASSATSTRRRSGTSSWCFRAPATFARSPRISLYGLSARGLAINTAEAVGEEFPAFTHFWIERPAAARQVDRDLRAARERLDHRRLPVQGDSRASRP